MPSHNQPDSSVNQHSTNRSKLDDLDSVLDTAIIGAGIAGLTFANAMKGTSKSLAVFEKARGTGGRMSSKRVAYGSDSFMPFDLGCVSICAKSKLFQQQLNDWQQEGVVTPWWKEEVSGELDRLHYVSIPRNSALTRHLSKHVNCYFSTRIDAINKVDGIWQLLNDTGEIVAKAKQVVLAAPPAQAYDLLAQAQAQPLRDLLSEVEVAPQWVMGIEVDSLPLELPELSRPSSNIIGSISQETLKPSRASDAAIEKYILQVQATADWTREHLDNSKNDVSELLTDELSEILKQNYGHKFEVLCNYSHRWLYSYVTKGMEADNNYVLHESGLALIGDYINNSGHKSEGIEAAWLSGKQLAAELSK